jgi:hypothetical protein
MILLLFRAHDPAQGRVEPGWDRSRLAAPSGTARKLMRRRYKAIHDFCKDLSLRTRGHSVMYEGERFHVYCFAEAGDAEKFMQRFGGEKFDPRQRGKGSNWARWNK